MPIKLDLEKKNKIKINKEKKFKKIKFAGVSKSKIEVKNEEKN